MKFLDEIKKVFGINSIEAITAERIVNEDGIDENSKESLIKDILDNNSKPAEIIKENSKRKSGRKKKIIISDDGEEIESTLSEPEMIVPIKIRRVFTPLKNGIGMEEPLTYYPTGNGTMKEHVRKKSAYFKFNKIEDAAKMIKDITELSNSIELATLIDDKTVYLNWESIWSDGILIRLFDSRPWRIKK